jgi:hypothetical protein
MKSLIIMLIASALLVFGMQAKADTVYNLPDPTVTVNPNYSGTTTIVTIGGVSYRGPSAYYYVSACATPNRVGYHCSILEEDDVTLTAPDGSTLVATIIYQAASVLIRSGHNLWRSSALVLDGTVTIPGPDPVPADPVPTP